MKKRIPIFLLALSLLLPALSGCGESKKETPETTTAAVDTTAPAEVTEETETEDPRKTMPDNLPADLNFGGAAVRILGYSNSNWSAYDICGLQEESGDLVFDAVYDRTRKVEERLNVTIEPDLHESKWQDYASLMRSLVQSGDDSYGMFYTMGNASIQSSNDKLFRDLADAPYLDFSQPWWWKEAMDELSLDGSTYRYLVGDISLTHYMTCGCTFFNKALYEDTFGDPDELYKLTLDGGWTLDTFRKMAGEAYRDVNGNGAVDEGDVYGSIVGNPELLKQLEYATDLQRYTRDENGYISFGYDEERAALLTEKLVQLLYETPGVEYRSAYTASQLFSNRSMVFFLERLNVTFNGVMREMEDDFGIIPLPKLDESQKEYRALIHNNSEFVVVPKPAAEPEMACAVIEAMCAESYRSVIQPFYEQAMKLKYSRDAYSGQCIDLIRQGARKVVLYEYDDVFNQCATIITSCVREQSTNFSSTYAKRKSAASKTIEKYMDKFEKDKEAEENIWKPIG